MHWMSLHLLAAREGNLNVFVLGLHVVLGRGVAARGARVHWEWCYSVSFCCLLFVVVVVVVLFVVCWLLVVGGYWWLLWLLLLLLVGKSVAARGGNLKKNKLEGGWGGGRSASPPDALDVLASLSRERRQP